MKRVLLGAALLALSGCAGVATYNVRPFYETTLQKVICCEAVITNGKDISSVNVDVAKQSGLTISSRMLALAKIVQ